SSAKSLSFLSLLRGGRRGTGDRRVRTVCQPAGRQRRGLKGLFNSVKFRSKDKEEETPPSPLLMSSRANSVEIIKEDLTLTPKSHPRSLDSLETESCEPDMSFTTPDSTAVSSVETLSPQVKPSIVSRTNEHVPPLPTSEPPLEPGDNSLSCLLADISSLLTFDSITGGGDIMADVEAEWGKASSPVSVSARAPPVTQSAPTPVAFTQPPSAKLDSASCLNLQPSTSYKPSLNSAAGESKPPVIVSPPSAVTTKPSFSTPVPPSKVTPVPTSTLTSGSLSAALSKPTLTSSPMDLSKTPPSLVSAPDKYPSSTPTATTRTQPCSASVPTPSSISLDTIAPMTKHIPAPVSLDKMPSVPTPAPAPTTHAVVIPAFPTLPTPAHIPVSQFKAPPAPAEIPISVSKDSPAQMQVSQSKVPPVTAQIPMHVSNDLPVPVKMEVSQSKVAPVTAQIPARVSNDPPAPVQMQNPQSKALPVTAQIPISVTKAPPAHIPVSISTGLPAPVNIPYSVSKDPPTQITVSQSNAPPAPCPVTSPRSTPAAWLSEAPASAKMRGNGQASVNQQLISPSSTGAPGAQTMLSKTEELHNESRTSLQGASRESRIPLVKASGLSKIPVVGGGRAAKPPVRDSQHVDGEASRDPPTPVEEERPRFYSSHDAGSKDKISDVEAFVPTSKHTQEESQQPPQAKVLTSLPRDSKIPVKHGASNIPQAKEPSRTKIPVSKVPVRRAGNKPAAAGGSSQMRK
ncbi:proline-rich protein 36-like, partial [Clinocottus analis]|uniref:proline-rich protein 36-like n=1 Tax=Clinocottus analis TaxID=304258 RepID=UPI0035BFA703